MSDEAGIQREEVPTLSNAQIANELAYLADLLDEWNMWPSDEVLREAASRLRHPEVEIDVDTVNGRNRPHEGLSSADNRTESE